MNNNFSFIIFWFSFDSFCCNLDSFFVSSKLWIKQDYLARLHKPNDFNDWLSFVCRIILSTSSWLFEVNYFIWFTDINKKMFLNIETSIVVSKRFKILEQTFIDDAIKIFEWFSVILSKNCLKIFNSTSQIFLTS